MTMSCDTPLSWSSTGRRRFTNDQLKYLQLMFQTDSRPQPQILQQLANQLGLHPRQVAIWFQNRRARSKTKLMTHDYCVLKAYYDALASDVDSLRRQNCSLHLQLRELRNALERSQRAKQACNRNKHQPIHV